MPNPEFGWRKICQMPGGRLDLPPFKGMGFGPEPEYEQLDDVPLNQTNWWITDHVQLYSPEFKDQFVVGFFDVMDPLDGRMPTAYVSNPRDLQNQGFKPTHWRPLPMQPVPVSPE